MASNRDVEKEGASVARSIFWLFGEMFLVPIRTFIFGMERLLETMRGMQQAGHRSMEVMAGGPPSADIRADESSAMPPLVTESIESELGAAPGGTEKVIEEMERMDKDLNDDMLKLVRYKILFVKRDYEHAFPEEEALVSDNIDGSAFTAWKIAEFIQKLGTREDGKTASPIAVPGDWKDYPGKEYTDSGKLTGFPEDDKKYLRLFYEVLERYHREKFRYEEDHIDELKKQTRVLREIKDEMSKTP